MCYLIAKKHTEPGCIAVKTKSDKALAGLVQYLGLRLLKSDVQVLTVSSPEAYGEYEPYNFVSSEEEFISKALHM